MSTTLVPPSYYIVKPRGQPARRYPTIAHAASAMAQLAPTPTAIGALTGQRTRSLTAGELRELGRHVRAHRLRADKILSPDPGRTVHRPMSRS